MDFLDILKGNLQSFNTREIAVLVWLFCFFSYFLFKKEIRHSFYDAVKTFWKLKILVGFIAMASYVTLSIFLLYKARLWDFVQLKHTAWWTLSVGFIILGSVITERGKQTEFKKIVFDAIKVTVLLEFLINLYTFHIIIEFILVPILAIAAAMLGYSEVKDGYKDVKKLFEYFLAIVGTVILVVTLYVIIKDPTKFATLSNLRSFLLPPALTTLYIPFLYCASLIATYEILFMRVNIFSDDPSLARYAKLKFFWLCKLNLKKLKVFSQGIGVLNIRTKDDVISIINSNLP